MEPGAVAVRLASAEPLLRLGMRVACADGGMTVVAEAGDGAALRDAAVALDLSTVIVSELDLLRPAPVETVRELAGRHRVLLLDEDGIDRPSFLRAGASGFLCRRTPPPALREAVASAQRGQLVLSGYEPNGTGSAPPPPATALTSRERNVLRLIATGSSTDAAAYELHLSPTTVKTHLRSASSKLGTHSRAAAVARAMELRLLD